MMTDEQRKILDWFVKRYPDPEIHECCIGNSNGYTKHRRKNKSLVRRSWWNKGKR